MKEAIDKMRYLLQSLADKEGHESVEVAVRVIRELGEALSEADTDRRVRESLEIDLIELQTQRSVLMRTQDGLYDELNTYKRELRLAQAKLNALYRAAGKMRDALADYTRNAPVQGERITEPGDAA